MKSVTVVVVEDDDLKHRTVVRILRQLLPAILGVDEVTIARAKDAAEAMRVLYMLERDAKFVITDWRFPLSPGGPEVTGAGQRVVDWCMDFGIPFGVISGSERVAELGDAWLPWGSNLATMREALVRRLRA